MRNQVWLWTTVAGVSAGCAVSDTPDVARRDVSTDQATDATRPMDAMVDAGASETSTPPDAGMDVVTPPADVVPEIACTTMCGGSCTDTNIDPRNCGACFRDCANLMGVDPARARCMAGFCQIRDACMPNRGDCNNDATDGCETDLGTAANCGVCGTACVEPSPICTMMAGGGPTGFRCGTGCVAPTADRCASRCVDFQTDSRNCGSCGTVCPTAINGTGACVAGRCAVMCNPGFGDCDGLATNGCETSTNTSTVHCGTCGNVCPGIMGATPACNTGVCGIRCTTGTGDCDMNPANGCETNITNQPQNCGACGRVCGAAPNAMPTCSSNICSFACMTGFGNCDFSSINGCEADLSTNARACGACGRICTTPANAVATCVSSACSFTCAANFGDCNMLGTDGCEAAFASNVLHCGACNNACPTPANGTPLCTAGTCGARCTTGFGDCDGNAANGCETATTTAMAHCGGCGMACAAPANATAMCAASRCVITCDAGFTLSGATCLRSPPQPVTPWNGAVVTSRRPIFRVALALGQDAAQIEVCGNRTCTIIARTFDVMGPTGVFPVDLIPGIYYWRARGRIAGGVVTSESPVFQFSVPNLAVTATVAGQWGTTLNPNGDGVADVIIGSPSANRADFRFGPTISSGAAMTGTTGHGTSVASAGDVNVDGFTDVVIGGPTSTGGVVNIHHAVSSTFSAAASVSIPAPAATVRFGAYVTSLGDVNADGYADIAVATGSNRVYVYHGSPTGVSSTPATVISPPAGATGVFGSTLSRAADFNHDGFGDLVVGHDGSSQSAYLYLGSASGLGATPIVISGPASSGFGRAVDVAGDVNGDGYLDLAVGAYAASRLYVFHGSAGGFAAAPSTIVGVTAGLSQLGLTVSFGGDTDGDGYGDVLAASPSNGVTLLYFGSATGLDEATRLTFSLGAGAGTSLSAGDIYASDGLFLSDVVIGRPAANVVYLYRGSRTRSAITTLYTSATITTSTGTSVAAQ
ncbi:MAG: FG-GAP-like repeat-containing protein [Deltaproteobacteria bacterium]|nr:FG-GAP-like repeat-containing protein [Deltaproteobacteria bacterium]